jgi:hypothetical protein
VQARSPAQAAPPVERRADHPGHLPVDRPLGPPVHHRTHPLPHLTRYPASAPIVLLKRSLFHDDADLEPLRRQPSSGLTSLAPSRGAVSIEIMGFRSVWVWRGRGPWMYCAPKPGVHQRSAGRSLVAKKGVDFNTPATGEEIIAAGQRRPRQRSSDQASDQDRDSVAGQTRSPPATPATGLGTSSGQWPPRAAPTDRTPPTR